MRISDWSSDVCSSDLFRTQGIVENLAPHCGGAIIPVSLPLFKPKRPGGVGEPVAGCPAHDSAVGVNIGAGAQFPKAGIGLIVNLPCSLAHFFQGEEVFMSAHAIQPLVDIGLNRGQDDLRSEEHTSELQSLMRTSYAVF